MNKIDKIIIAALVLLAIGMFLMATARRGPRPKAEAVANATNSPAYTNIVVVSGTEQVERVFYNGMQVGYIVGAAGGTGRDVDLFFRQVRTNNWDGLNTWARARIDLMRAMRGQPPMAETDNTEPTSK